MTPVEVCFFRLQLEKSSAHAQSRLLCARSNTTCTASSLNRRFWRGQLARLFLFSNVFRVAWKHGPPPIFHKKRIQRCWELLELSNLTYIAWLVLHAPELVELFPIPSELGSGAATATFLPEVSNETWPFLNFCITVCQFSMYFETLGKSSETFQSADAFATVMYSTDLDQSLIYSKFAQNVFCHILSFASSAYLSNVLVPVFWSSLWTDTRLSSALQTILQMSTHRFGFLLFGSSTVVICASFTFSHAQPSMTSLLRLDSPLHTVLFLCLYIFVLCSRCVAWTVFCRYCSFQQAERCWLSAPPGCS